MSFWADYVILKEQQGVSRDTTLDLIEQRYGKAKRDEIETEISQVVE